MNREVMNREMNRSRDESEVDVEGLVPPHQFKNEHTRTSRWVPGSQLWDSGARNHERENSDDISKCTFYLECLSKVSMCTTLRCCRASDNMISLEWFHNRHLLFSTRFLLAEWLLTRSAQGGVRELGGGEDADHTVSSSEMRCGREVHSAQSWIKWVLVCLAEVDFRRHSQQSRQCR